MNTQKQGRLSGKIALITGAAGNIGEVITRRFLEEGASVILAGRNLDKLDDMIHRLQRQSPELFKTASYNTLRVDGASIEEVRRAMDMVFVRPSDSPTFIKGPIDILVNNAGSAGPKQPLHKIPLSRGDLQALQEAGSTDSETLHQAFGNLLGISWNFIRAAYPHLAQGASVINVSTIFSRTDYYGRIAYVVPKAALNALSTQLAQELGRSGKGIRLNTVYPGPIDSERIRNVFKAMDGLKGQEDGATATGFFDIMRLERPQDSGTMAAGFPKKNDVANAIVFLGSDEAAALSGHAIEVTNGMAVEAESQSSFVSRPGLRIVDAEGKVVLVAAGAQIGDALHFARVQAKCGAKVALTCQTIEQRDEAEKLLTDTDHKSIVPFYFGTEESDDVDYTLEQITLTLGRLDAALIMPTNPTEIYGHSLLTVSDELAERFVQQDLEQAVVVSSYLAEYWRKHDSEMTEPPKVIFVTNGADGNGNTFGEVYKAGIEQLCRVWRHEEQIDVAAGRKTQAVWANQIVRYSNTETENLSFAASWAAKLLNGDRRIKEINLYLPENIEAATGAQKPSFGWAESLFGLHLGKVALITGGSAGIGGQIGRLLAMSGAKVVLAARHRDQLEETRASILEELRQIGYNRPEGRVLIVPDMDVANEPGLKDLVEKTLDAYGRIDYLINNAGMSGAEEMVIDMPVDSWRYTIQANLTSNYSLIHKIAPMMKAQGSGYIVNVSSYFGGEKYVAVPYPNRADYAVSKAGQRALVEMLARFLGPQIQINAIAPGPVDGIRLAGNSGRPGLYQRRGRLIMEGKRLSDLYSAIIEVQRANGPKVEQCLAMMASNSVEVLANNELAPEPLVKLARSLAKKTTSDGSAYTCLMNTGIAKKLIARLELSSQLRAPVAANEWLQQLPNAPEPFFTPAEIEKEATKIRESTIGMLNLGKMPNEQDVALATIYYLADRNVSGDTFHPSGGLRFDRTVTEGELFGKPSPGRLEKFYGRTVIIVGDYMQQPIMRLAHSYLDEHQAGRVVILTKTPDASGALRQHFDYYAKKGRFFAYPIGQELEAGLDMAIVKHGVPLACVSTPFDSLPHKPLIGENGNWSGTLDEADFGQLIENHLTHHFRIARKMSLVDGVQVVLVTPETSRDTKPEEFGVANFIKTSLHALTVTLGVENERNVHHVPVNQVDLTRRARTEEPQNEEEEEEELSRFVNAVLLTSAPLPDAATSRYRSRIYRGNAITV